MLFVFVAVEHHDPAASQPQIHRPQDDVLDGDGRIQGQDRPLSWPDQGFVIGKRCADKGLRFHQFPYLAGYAMASLSMQHAMTTGACATKGSGVHSFNFIRSTGLLMTTNRVACRLEPDGASLAASSNSLMTGVRHLVALEFPDAPPGLNGFQQFHSRTSRSPF